jgi:hypothetical protein
MSAVTVEVIDAKTIFVDGERYIKSWKGTKVTKRMTPAQRSQYMATYRQRKRRELAALSERNARLEDEILALLGRSDEVLAPAKKNDFQRDCIL